MIIFKHKFSFWEPGCPFAERISNITIVIVQTPSGPQAKIHRFSNIEMVQKGGKEVDFNQSGFSGIPGYKKNVVLIRRNGNRSNNYKPFAELIVYEKDPRAYANIENTIIFRKKVVNEFHMRVIQRILKKSKGEENASI